MTTPEPNTVHLVPCEGRVVRDPATGKPLPEEGAVVELGRFWIRRLRDGDVEEAAPARAGRGKKSKPTTEA